MKRKEHKQSDAPTNCAPPEHGAAPVGSSGFRKQSTIETGVLTLVAASGVVPPPPTSSGYRKQPHVTGGQLTRVVLTTTSDAYPENPIGHTTLTRIR
jgi:hypothetical protein